MANLHETHSILVVQKLFIGTIKQRRVSSRIDYMYFLILYAPLNIALFGEG